MDLLKALQHLQECGPIENRVGVCWNLNALHASQAQFRIIAHHWPGRDTEDLAFMVPSGTPGISAHSAYLDGVIRGKSLWDKNTPYGRNRHDLLQFCIDYLIVNGDQG